MAKQIVDVYTRDFLSPVRGRPRSVKPAMTSAERQRVYRAKKKEEGKDTVTVCLPVDLIEQMKAYVKFKDIPLDLAFERACKNFVRKR